MFKLKTMAELRAMAKKIQATPAEERLIVTKMEVQAQILPSLPIHLHLKVLQQ
jgi:hypothetical protein